MDQHTEQVLTETLTAFFMAFGAADRIYVVQRASVLAPQSENAVRKEQVLGLIARLQRHNGGAFVTYDAYRHHHADEPAYLTASALRERFGGDWLRVNEEAAVYNAGGRSRPTLKIEDARQTASTQQLLDALCLCSWAIDVPRAQLTERRYLRFRGLFRELTNDRPHERPFLPALTRFDRIGGFQAAAEQADRHQWDGLISDRAFLQGGRRQGGPPEIQRTAPPAVSRIDQLMAQAVADGNESRKDAFEVVKQQMGWQRLRGQRGDQLHAAYERAMDADRG